MTIHPVWATILIPFVWCQCPSHVFGDPSRKDPKKRRNKAYSCTYTEWKQYYITGSKKYTITESLCLKTLSRTISLDIQNISNSWCSRCICFFQYMFKRMGKNLTFKTWMSHRGFRRQTPNPGSSRSISPKPSQVPSLEEPQRSSMAGSLLMIALPWDPGIDLNFPGLKKKCASQNWEGSSSPIFRGTKNSKKNPKKNKNIPLTIHMSNKGPGPKNCCNVAIILKDPFRSSPKPPGSLPEIQIRVTSGRLPAEPGSEPSFRGVGKTRGKLLHMVYQLKESFSPSKSGMFFLLDCLRNL